MKFFTSLVTGFSLSTLRTQGFYTALTQLKTSGIMSVIVAIPKLIAGLVAYRIENGKGMISTLGFKGALDALNISMKAFTVAGIIAGIVGIIALYDTFTTTTAEWQEELQEVKSELSELQSEGESLNNELKTTQDRINELQNKGSLTLVEENELKRLKQENAELQRKIDLNRIAQQEKQKETRETFVNTMESELDDRNVRISGGYISGQEMINSQFKRYKQAQDKLIELEQDYVNGKIAGDKYKSEKESIDEQLDSISKYLTDKYETFSKELDNVEYGIDPETDAYIDRINEFNDKYILAVGDTESIQNLWNDILNRTKFSEANNALTELANTGELTAESIAKLAQNNYNVAELLAYLNQLGLIDLSKVVTDNNKDGFISADEIKNTKDFKKSLDGIPGMFNKVEDSAKDTEEAVSDLADTFDKLDQISDAFGSLNKAFGELKDDGKIAFSTLDSIQEKFSKLGNVDDEWLQKQINALASAKGNTEATNKVLGELAQKYVSAQFTAEELANANQDVIASMLREQGVANANKVAMQMIAQAKLNAAIQSGELANMSETEVANLVSEANSAQITAQAMKIYAFEKQLANKNSLDTSKSVSNLLNMAKAAGVTGQKVADLIQLKAMLSQIEFVEKKSKSNWSTYQTWVESGNLDRLKNDAKTLRKKIKSNDYTDNTDLKFDPIKFTGDDGKGNNNNSSSNKSYTAKEDPWLKKRQAELDKAAHQHEMGKITEDQYLEKVKKVEAKFLPKIRKKQAGIAKMQNQWDNMTKKQKKSKKGQKIKADLEQAKEDLQSIKDKNKEIDEEIHNLRLENRKDEYEKYKNEQINKYVDGKINEKQLKSNLKKKLKALFGSFDKDTYNELLSGMGDDIDEAMSDRFDSDINNLDKKRDFDLVNENDYWKQKLAIAKSYYDKSEQFADDYSEVLVDSYEYAKEKYKESLEEQRDALEEQQDAISEFYDKQKELLQDQSDEDTYKKDQSDKRKTVNDLKTEIAQLSQDTSERARKRIAELQSDLIDAEDELSEFEREHALDQTIAALEESEEKLLDSIDKQIESIDKQVSSIDDNISGIYAAVRQYAKTNLGLDLPENPIKYASGTSSSIGGLVTTQENKLAELIGMNTGSGTFTMLTPSSKVWNNEATEFLYKFANNPTKSLLEKLGESTNSIAQNITTVNNTSEYNINIQKGAVVVQGNADKKVLDNATKDLAYNLLTEFKKLK